MYKRQLSLLILGVGSVAASINLIATILTQRAPGLTIRRLPLFVWMIFINSFLVILALPALNAAIVMLFIDRHLGTHFFAPANGGSAVLWQHFFWEMCIRDSIPKVFAVSLAIASASPVTILIFTPIVSAVAIVALRCV